MEWKILTCLDYQQGYGDVWPLSQNELRKLITNRQALIDALDASWLSDNLLNKEVLNQRQHEFILFKSTKSEKNEALLAMLFHGSINQYNQTIEFLRELRQGRILSILQEVGGDKYVYLFMDEWEKLIGSVNTRIASLLFWGSDTLT